MRRPRPAHVLGGGLVLLCVGLGSVSSCSAHSDPGGAVGSEGSEDTEKSGAASGAAGETNAPSAGVPYMPHQWVQAPEEPPDLRLEGGAASALPRVAVDWSLAGGPFEEPEGEVDWSEAERGRTNSDIELEFDTDRIPTRVVIYSYADVGENGVPDEDDGTEELCSFDGDGTDMCRYHGDGSGNVRMVIDPPHIGEHVVVHAAWPTEMTGEAVDVVSASWLLRTDA